MIADVVIAARAIELASLHGPASSVDGWGDTKDPDLDGTHLVVACYGGGYDLSVAQLLAWCGPAEVADYEQRGLVVVGPDGRLGITVGRGYVVEPCGPVYAVTLPEQGRWVAAYRPPTLLSTVAP